MNAWGRIISWQPGLTVAEFKGSPGEIGMAHGRLFALDIALMRKRLVSYLSGITLGLGGSLLLWHFERQAEKMDPYVPEDLRDEMRGIAEGSGQSYRFILLMNALDDVLVNMGCSSFALAPERTREGKLVVGRNLDYPLFRDILPKFTTVFKITPTEGRAFVSVAWPGFSALVTGMNDAGVFVADLTSISKDRSPVGIPALILNRAALQSSATLDSLVDTIRGSRRTVGKNLMAASPSGAKVLELSSTRFQAREMSEGFVACTNHYEVPEMEKFQGSIKLPPKTGLDKSYYSYGYSKERLERIKAHVSSGGLGIGDVKAALRAEPVSNQTTVQSVVCVPEDLRMLVAIREETPVCQGEYTDLAWLMQV